MLRALDARRCLLAVFAATFLGCQYIAGALGDAVPLPPGQCINPRTSETYDCSDAGLGGGGGSGGASSASSGASVGGGGAGGKGGAGGSGGALSPGQTLWAKDFGAATLSSTQLPRTVATDGAGAVIMGGALEGTVNFGGMDLVSAGGTDAVLVKLDKLGNHVWSKRFGDVSDQVVTAVATDAMGNVFAAGTFYGTINLGGSDLTAASAQIRKIFVAKFNPSGQHLWSKGYGDNMPDAGSAHADVPGIALGPAGDPVLTGWFYGTIDFGQGLLSAPPYGATMFVVKLGSSNGNTAWNKSFTGMGTFGIAQGLSVAVNASGSIAVAGFGTPTIGATTVIGNAFVTKLDPQGNPTWTKGFSIGYEAPINSTQNLSVAFDGSGNAIVAGYCKNGTDLGGGNLVPPGSSEGMFIAQLAPDGSHIWSKSYASTMGLEVHVQLAIVPSGGIVVSGRYKDKVDLGGGPLPVPPTSQSYGIFLARFDSNGTHVWSRGIGESSTLGSAVPIALDPGGELALTAPHSGTADFGLGQLTAVGDVDFVVAKVVP